MNKFLVSPLITQQVPDFIREDHNTFVLFLQKYYEWLETDGQVIKSVDELSNSKDIDLASDYYINIIKKEFLPDFPETLAIDKRKLLKIVNNFYSAKGTPDSVKFLFRALFDEEVEIYFPSEDILKTSDGKWVQPVILRLESNDPNITKIEKTLITGLTSKATAIVEEVVKKIDKNSGLIYYEIYISKVERTFQTGEFIIAYYYEGTTLTSITARIIGFVSQINVDPNNRGLFYRGVEPSVGYTGDPVSIVGGLNPSSNTPIELASASARVTEVSKGSITNLFVDEGGFGFRNFLNNANTSIVDFEGGFTDIAFDTEATGYISLVDTSKPRLITLSNVVIDTINSAYANINVFANTVSYPEYDSNTAHPNSNSINVTTTTSFTVFPLSFITVVDSGKGYGQRPSVDVYSYYLENKAPSETANIHVTINPGLSTVSNTSQNLSSIYEPGDQVRLFVRNKLEEIREVTSVTANTLTFDRSFGLFNNPVTDVSVSKVLRRDLKKIGSIGRIGIITPGSGYSNGDSIIFVGGDGYGAKAYVNVNATGSIVSVTMEKYANDAFVIGGEGYNSEDLPSVNVQTSTGSNTAVLEVLEICGDGESLRTETNKIGSVLKITLDSFGYDYVSTPIVSLKNADLSVSNITIGETFTSNVKIYQGPDTGNSTFQAWVTKFNTVSGVLRIHDFSGSLSTTEQIKTVDDTISANVNSVVYYGDGKARATAEFLQGSTKLSGLYLNLDGQLSADKYLQDDNKYHYFSYIINTKTPLDKVKTTLKSLSHPVGTKLFLTTKSLNEETKEITKKDLIAYSETQLQNTFNVSYCSNVIVSTTPLTSNLSSLVEIGDVLTIKTVVKGLQGTVNVSSSSNTIVGTNTVFLNDLYPNAVVQLSTGNTETVSTVFSSNSFVTINDINITQNNALINVVFDAIGTVTFVNSNTIFVDSNICGNVSFANVFVRKVVGPADIAASTIDSLRIFIDSTIITIDRE